MARPADLRTLERETYRAYWSDGLVDIYVGVSLLFIGAMWTWADDLAGLAGVLPAVLAVPALAARRRFIEARLGHVEWRPTRRSWEHRNLLVLLGVGVACLLLGVFVYLVVAADGGGTPGVAPGILAWLQALLAVGLAFLLDARRMLLYAGVLAVGGLVVVALQATPGWPMLAGGAVALTTGSVMLRRFTERYPVIEPS